ncbi:MAG: catalase family protein [Nostoc sp.]
MTILSNSKQEATTDAVLTASLKEQQEKGPDLRQMHTKSHGLVWGEFIVENDIDENLKVGIFAKPQTYPIWVRFSNASPPEKRGKLKSDQQPDVRAIAIKLMEVEGTKVLNDEEKTQDFILINHPVFFLRDAQGYLDLGKAGSGQATPELLQSLQPTFALLQEMTSKEVVNPIDVQYWSTTPYKLGSHAIKFSVKPQSRDEAQGSKSDSDNYLREALIQCLTNDAKEVKLDFLVQLYVDDEKTPIEDPTKEWKESNSPFIKVATIKIPSQQFDFEERKRLDEGLSFNPWHTLPEHEPLGSLNLARKKIYQELAEYRHEYVQKRLTEPQPYTSIQDQPQ